jgi:hypothetical protein
VVTVPEGWPGRSGRSGWRGWHPGSGLADLRRAVRRESLVRLAALSGWPVPDLARAALAGPRERILNAVRDPGQ